MTQADGVPGGEEERAEHPRRASQHMLHNVAASQLWHCMAYPRLKIVVPATNTRYVGFLSIEISVFFLAGPLASVAAPSLSPSSGATGAGGDLTVTIARAAIGIMMKPQMRIVQPKLIPRWCKSWSQTIGQMTPPMDEPEIQKPTAIPRCLSKYFDSVATHLFDELAGKDMKLEALTLTVRSKTPSSSQLVAPVLGRTGSTDRRAKS